MTRTVLALTFILGFALASCGGGNGGGTANIDCATFCPKMVACDASETEADCETRCQEMSGAFRAEVGARAEACADQACADQNACIQTALTGCGGDASGVVSAICAKGVACGSQVDQATCEAQYQMDSSLAVMACLNDATLSALETCANDAACATFSDDYAACVSQHTGISFN